MPKDFLKQNIKSALWFRALIFRKLKIKQQDIKLSPKEYSYTLLDFGFLVTALWRLSLIKILNECSACIFLPRMSNKAQKQM